MRWPFTGKGMLTYSPPIVAARRLFIAPAMPAN
jgi:hypothetical protein